MTHARTTPKLDSVRPIAFALLLAVAAVGGGLTVLARSDPAGRLLPLVLVGLVGILVILFRPTIGVIGGVLAIAGLGVARRLVGGQSAYVENDPLIAVPAVLLLPAVVLRLRFQTRARTETWLLVALLLLMMAATGYGLTRAPALAVLRSAAFEALPIALAVGVVWTRDTRIVQIVLTTLKLAAPAAAVYGLVQYFAPPAWDLAWLMSRGRSAATFGYAEQGEFRLFGPTSSPLAFATLLGVGILLWALQRAPLVLRIPMIALMIVPLLLTLVRTSVFALIVALVVALLRVRGARVLVPVLVGAAIAYVTVTLVAALNPDIASRFLVSNLGGDESYLARSALLAQYFTSSVLSLGIGFGTALNGTASVDNGFLAAFIELGLIGGVLYFTVPLLALLKTVRAGLPARLIPAELDAAAWGIVAFFLLSEISAPITQGEFGFVFWPCVGALILRKSDGETEDPRAGPRTAPRDDSPVRRAQ